MIDNPIYKIPKVYIVTILTKANKRFSISKVFASNEDAREYCDAYNDLLLWDDPYICEVIEMAVEGER